MSPRYLVTHSGGFHADEVLSSVILTRLFPEAELVRSRAPEWITPGADRVIYDVGGAYDAEAGIFDHHQRGAPLREDEKPYSSFGLVWKHFGLDYLRASGVPEEHLESVHGSFDRGFVLPVDLVDNGAVSVSEAGPLSSLTLPGLIETLKPVFDEQDPEAETRAFHAAVAIARQFVEARVARSAAKLRAEALVQGAIEAAGEGRILELPMGMPFRPAVIKAGADHLWFVVTPRQDDEWTLGGIRLADEGFTLRADLPEAWAGLTGADLDAVCGTTGAIFCHNGRFIAAAKSRETIMTMAQIAVAEAEKTSAEASQA
ncbi:MYG1 family protein [Pseudooceanicola sp. CBS1P-1]|uniref:MYG1 family protein n=1 Tax=Pseudooceanicola albus TaxID=2692189 RepID=A0A6L7FYR1_9RHOB|nr:MULTISPECIES: MYG1 family protein [Pseudooceanicola]MBT9383411.1 MYG1 family protein [Pseudooceanicola endophyticus]MXN16267.1 MYG1 family protein [Pseudooceanicola albus]